LILVKHHVESGSVTAGGPAAEALHFSPLTFGLNPGGTGSGTGFPILKADSRATGCGVLPPLLSFFFDEVTQPFPGEDPVCMLGACFTTFHGPSTGEMGQRNRIRRFVDLLPPTPRSEHKLFPQLLLTEAETGHSLLNAFPG